MRATSQSGQPNSASRPIAAAIAPAKPTNKAPYCPILMGMNASASPFKKRFRYLSRPRIDD
jgi:hypothetical protein